ncbi:MAG: oligopeptide transport system permease protein [Dehalococcoidia bacterium]|nr:oligopeptide transport system permease protein [Dehalococcoidia bacterium]
MVAYTVQRVLWTVPVLLTVASITFLLMHFVPGGPWDREKRLPPGVVESLNRRYGLDNSLGEQYWSFMTSALKGDLGVSYTYQGRGVTDIIRQGLPATATVGGVAFLIVVGVGIPLGMAAAMRRNSVVDYVSMSFATVFASIPGFVLGILMVIVLSVRWHLLPTGGLESPSHVIMPALALAALPTAFIARVTRASVLEELGQDYVRTARAKGLSSPMVQYRHVLRNALIPVLTSLGPELAALITGSFIIETVFSVPGIGRLFVQGVFQRDYGLIMGTVLFYAFVIAVLNLLVDILYAVVDPRIRPTRTDDA